LKNPSLIKATLNTLGIEDENSGTFAGTWRKSSNKGFLSSNSPTDGEEIAKIAISDGEDYEKVVQSSVDCFECWRSLPAPKRGNLVRDIGEEFRRYKDELGLLVSLEMGKILPEGKGEIQEVIDICDFAVGLSRQLYGKTMHSERPNHRMYEQWHPLGAVGVITAFNFPAAVWGWNAAIAAVCGDTVIWKPSELTPLTAFAITKICAKVATDHGFPGLFTLLTDEGPELGKRLAADSRIPLISATGSCRMGRDVAKVVGERLGRSLLELGGNNALIVLDDANLDLVVRAVVFGSVGTAGQRCTSTRRLIVDAKVKDALIPRLVEAYKQVTIGDPLDEKTLMGPLIHRGSVEQFLDAIEQVKKAGGSILVGGKQRTDIGELFVEPCIAEVPREFPLLKEETFAPLLYVISVDGIEEAIAVQNDVPQGLSSALFTGSVIHAERFLSAAGSDCGIANINIGTSGAEIGGAFGGEKDTGGGREAGSDSWKAYMRRQTNTINWGKDLPLAQGIKFD
jgi:aldehyde dehydrogenase (NAD+)